MDAIRRASKQQLLILTAVLIFGFLAFAYFADVGNTDENDDAEPVAYVIVSLVTTAIAWVLLNRLAPRVESRTDRNEPARVGLILAILAFVTGIAFWTGLPFALGVPALYLGIVGTERAKAGGEGGGQARAAAVIAIVAIVATAIVCVIG
jgi:hypothetical protein